MRCYRHRFFFLSLKISGSRLFLQFVSDYQVKAVGKYENEEKNKPALMISSLLARLIQTNRFQSFYAVTN